MLTLTWSKNWVWLMFQLWGCRKMLHPVWCGESSPSRVFRRKNFDRWGNIQKWTWRTQGPFRRWKQGRRGGKAASRGGELLPIWWGWSQAEVGPHPRHRTKIGDTLLLGVQQLDESGALSPYLCSHQSSTSQAVVTAWQVKLGSYICPLIACEKSNFLYRILHQWAKSHYLLGPALWNSVSLLTFDCLIMEKMEIKSLDCW